jgi:ubiquitin-conjugating enzyme E2 Z
VIQPLEESLNIAPGGKSIPASENTETSKGDVADEDEEERESYQLFDELRKRRFLWCYDTHMRTIDVEPEKVEINQLFGEMPFKMRGNEMKGRFNLPELKSRLITIKDQIIKETIRWTDEGLKAKKDDLGIASNCRFSTSRSWRTLKSENTFP